MSSQQTKIMSSRNRKRKERLHHNISFLVGPKIHYIPSFAIYYHTRFLLASIIGPTIYFRISCFTILTDDNIYVILYITNNFQFRFDDNRLALSSGTVVCRLIQYLRRHQSSFYRFLFVFCDIFLSRLFSLQPSTEIAFKTVVAVPIDGSAKDTPNILYIAYSRRAF